jgi:hypothetical protein
MDRILLLTFIPFIFLADSFSQIPQRVVRMEALHDFPQLMREGVASNRMPYAPFHVEEDLNALAGDDQNYTFQMAAAEGIFPGTAGSYTIRLNTLTERDGECVYNVYVNDQRAGLFRQNPPTNEFAAPTMLEWRNVEIPANAKIRVESNNWTNLQRYEDNFFEYARGRWTSVDFIPEEKMDHSTDNTAEIGIFDRIEKVGPAELPVRARHEEVDKAYYITSGGVNETSGINRFGFLNKTIRTDFVLETLLTPLGLNHNEKMETGIMIRSMDSSDTPYIACVLRGDGLVTVQYREAGSTRPVEIMFKVKQAGMIQIEKKGPTFTVSAARFGEEYERHSTGLPGLSGILRGGFFVCSNRAGQMELVRFSRVRYFEDISHLVNH